MFSRPILRVHPGKGSSCTLGSTLIPLPFLEPWDTLGAFSCDSLFSSVHHQITHYTAPASSVCSFPIISNYESEASGPRDHSNHLLAGVSTEAPSVPFSTKLPSLAPSVHVTSSKAIQPHSAKAYRISVPLITQKMSPQNTGQRKHKALYQEDIHYSII